jgi:hypothetical protein
MHSPIFIDKFWNQKLKIPSKFGFRLEFSDFNKIFFVMSSKYGNLFMVSFWRFLYYLFTKVIFEESYFELEKSVFEMNHTCTFWTIEYIREEFWKSIQHKSFKTNLRIYTNFDEWKQQVLLSIKHIWIHSSSKIWFK